MRRSRLSEQVVEEIDRMIREEGFGNGDKFYSENELTKKLDVSRASVREAVRILEISGRVTVRQGKGIFVQNKLEQGMDSFASWLKSNSSQLDEHFELRMILDPKAAASAARNAVDRDIRDMEEQLTLFDEQVSAKNLEGEIKSDRKFHLLMAKSTKNRSLYALMKTMSENLNEGWISSLSIPGRAEKTVNEHRAVLEAIKARDPDGAEKAMMSHLENALKEIKEYMRRNS
jgi:GntR family transcriptional repressor for pyruvate dehydrogenase complex